MPPSLPASLASDPAVIREFLRDRLTTVCQAQRECEQETLAAMRAGKRGKENRARGKADYWRHVACGIRWMIRTIGR